MPDDSAEPKKDLTPEEARLVIELIEEIEKEEAGEA